MGSKTEKPTHKRLKDSAEKGQIMKSRDIVVTCVILCGVCYLFFFFDVNQLIDLLKDVFNHQFKIRTEVYAKSIVIAGFMSLIPFILLCVIATAFVSWMQSQLEFASKAIKINFDALNPVDGFKRMFSLRTLKDFIKTLLYLVFFTAASYVFWNGNKKIFFIGLDGDVSSLLYTWGQLLLLLVLHCLGSLIIVLIFDYIAEYFLFMKDMKMDKEEVKREFKEQEGDPELKFRRKELHREILSEQLKSDISNSRLIIANPTHIAIGIFFKPNLSPIPLIAVRETNQVALAVRAYAEEIGVPVIRDIKLARRIYTTHRRYDYVCLEEIDAVLRLLIWLEDVDRAGNTENHDDFNTSEEGGETHEASSSHSE
ncbi:TPA: EscU/YscU/HrcU family type III secretion system export apparatus switch protein [Yersinia enterocolitica]|nr:EscU/YscU/HrcU family type III secretion system export apparatus switch protein [Yersinia enterocolitica]HDL6985268.1 EscU/YscU/HrcU family type III secretion system export apparatus switch protein [Yersinia enterocolitica]HDL7067810.1 EscU/YscU/HrcU family type III secretion system export apparatus switch protein [Yersinia enterocolitica]HDL7072199.1 EscU/YscU/HrcU family type III secretion system export apparatus switch protein [Yersinia enterocolitica]